MCCSYGYLARRRPGRAGPSPHPSKLPNKTNHDGRGPLGLYTIDTIRTSPLSRCCAGTSHLPSGHLYRMHAPHLHLNQGPCMRTSFLLSSIQTTSFRYSRECAPTPNVVAVAFVGFVGLRSEGSQINNDDHNSYCGAGWWWSERCEREIIEISDA